MTMVASVLGSRWAVLGGREQYLLPVPTANTPAIDYFLLLLKALCVF